MLHEGKHIQETCGIPEHFCTRHWGDTHQVQQGEVQSPAPGEEQPHVPGRAGGYAAGKQPGSKGPGGPCGQRVEYKPTVCPCCKENHNSYTYLLTALSQDADPYSVLSIVETTPGELHSVLCSLV